MTYNTNKLKCAVQNGVLTVLIIYASTVNSCFAQIPDTEIFMADMKLENGVYTFGIPENITNRKGYDNQPRFSPKGNMLYYVSMMDNKQSDLMLYGVEEKIHKQITNTPESEYSPTPIRGTDFMTVVRVDKDSSQHVYKMSKVGRNPELLTPENDSIGYHAWVDEKHIALFVLGNPITLQVYDLTTHTYDTIAKNIGRSLHGLNWGASILFTQKTSDSTWAINKYSQTDKKIENMGACIIGVEDFGVSRDGKLFSGKDGKLFMMNPFGDKQWRQVADFSKEVGNFYRIAISPLNSKIAVVGYAGKKP